MQADGSIEQKALIISPAYGIPWEWSNPLFLEFPKARYLVTNWGTFSPAYNDVLEEFQVKSLPSGLYQSENVYVMVDSSTIKAIVQFIKEHEGVNITAKAIYSLPSRCCVGTVYSGVTLFKLQQQP